MNPAARYTAWLSGIHARSGLAATCTALANESRTWSGWDRVSVVVGRGRRSRIEAISGLDSFDRRAAAVRHLDNLAAGLFSNNSWKDQPEMLTFPDGTQTDPGIAATSAESPAARLATACQGSGVQQMAVLPLTGERGHPIGILIFENIDSTAQRTIPPADLALLIPEAGRALQQGLAFENASRPWPFRWVSRRGLAGTLLPLAILVGVLSALFIRIPVIVTGSGRLEPERRQDLFAGINGIVSELLVSQGEQVTSGQPLLKLRSPELDLELARLQGELLTVRQQIADLQTLRGDPRQTGAPGTSAIEMAAREQELRTVQESLAKQLAVIEQEQSALTLRSPLNGTVLTWDVKHLLTDRPVNRTDRLLTVAQIDGPWRADLHVDQRDLGPVLQAIGSGRAAATIVSADAPEAPIPVTIREIAPGISEYYGGEALLTLSGEVPAETVLQLRPGTTVLFRIRCEPAALGYVCFRRLIDRLTAWWRV